MDSWPAAVQTRRGSVRLLRLLGRGATSGVFEGDGGVAVKLLLCQPDDPTGPARFEREVAICSRLNHPALVRVLDWGAQSPWLFMVMELVSGQTLKEVLKQAPPGGLPVPLVTRWMGEILHGLGAAHQAGVVHRDVKPSNLMLATSGHVKILDFGCARDAQAATLTARDAAIGTPRYMAPEHFNARTVVPASDLYSLAVVVYELLAGCTPWDDLDLWTMVTRKVMEEPPRVHSVRPDVPIELSDVLFRMLDPTVAQRPISIEEVLPYCQSPSN